MHIQEIENIHYKYLYTAYGWDNAQTQNKCWWYFDCRIFMNCKRAWHARGITDHSIWKRQIPRASHGLKPLALLTVLPLGLKWCSHVHYNSGIIWCPGISTAQDSVEHTRLGQSIIKLISDLTSTLVTYQRNSIRLFLFSFSLFMTWVMWVTCTNCLLFSEPHKCNNFPSVQHNVKEIVQPK